MNHLAHLFLSAPFEKLMVGNFIADAVKGRKYLNYNPEISKGIVMHRAIDTFTDAHDLVRKSKSLLKDSYGLYSSVLVDLFYDFVLASNWNNYSSESLGQFSAKAYLILEKYTAYIPERSRRMLFNMKKENWLLNYSHPEGIESSLLGMSRRIKNNPGIEKAHRDLRKHYDVFEQHFTEFFPLLSRHVSHYRTGRQLK